MSLRNWTPCDEPDMDGHHCPYTDDGDYVNCEYWCGAEEPQDDPEIWEEDEDDDWDEEDDFDWDENIEDDFDDLDAAVLLILMVDE